MKKPIDLHRTFMRYALLHRYRTDLERAKKDLYELAYPEPGTGLEDDRYFQMCQAAEDAIARVLDLVDHDISTNPDDAYQGWFR